MIKKSVFVRAWFFVATVFFCAATLASTISDPLPSWNEGTAKKAILNFVKSTVDKNSPQFVPIGERIAAFDQDGTLWVEQLMYTQVVFALDRVNDLAPKHPEWRNKEPFKSVIDHDLNAIANFTLKDLEEIIMVTHTGMTVEDFQKIVKAWLKKAKNTRWNRTYTELIYQPMLEVIILLQNNGYRTYIVTGGGQEFVRVYAKQVYNIPPEQIIGSALKTEYSYDKKGQGILVKESAILLNNNMSGKPEDIYLFTGHKPQAAFGNSTGDQQMLEYTQSNNGARLMMLVHHDDAVREYEYGMNSKIGTFSESLMLEANRRGWQVISMKNDWKYIFPFEQLNEETS